MISRAGLCPNVDANIHGASYDVYDISDPGQRVCIDLSFSLGVKDRVDTPYGCSAEDGR